MVTETNVPHKENISYFGNGDNEAHMVYQFPLPPLTLFTFLSQDSTKLTQWAISLESTKLSKKTTYFNFLASHDGIGLRPIEGILNREEKSLLVKNTLRKKGRIGYRTTSNGVDEPYEMNINYLDALVEPGMTNQEIAQIFMASQAIILSLQGIPGIYIHSLLGSRNDLLGLEASNIPRRINRERLKLEDVSQDLSNESSIRSLVFTQYKRLLQIRRKHVCFSPLSSQKVLQLHQSVFALLRTSEDANTLLLFAVNVCQKPITIKTNFAGKDLISGKDYTEIINLDPHQFVWILKRVKK